MFCRVKFNSESYKSFLLCANFYAIYCRIYWRDLYDENESIKYHISVTQKFEPKFWKKKRRGFWRWKCICISWTHSSVENDPIIIINLVGNNELIMPLWGFIAMVDSKSKNLKLEFNPRAWDDVTNREVSYWLVKASAIFEIHNSIVTEGRENWKWKPAMNSKVVGVIYQKN